MIILGLDPGIARTGYGIINTELKKPFVACGCLTTTNRDSVSDRIHAIGQDLEQLIKQYSPDRAIIEEIFFGTNLTTAVTTSQTRGALIYVLRSRHIPIESLTPLQIKSRLTGYGKASKQQMQKMVKDILGLPSIPQPDDAADALAAALCLLDSKETLPNLTNYDSLKHSVNSPHKTT